MRRNGRSVGGTSLARIVLFAGLPESILGVAFLAAQVPRTEIADSNTEDANFGMQAIPSERGVGNH